MTKPGETQVRVYRAADAVRGALAGESVAVLGYGHLGRTAALNLRDSGVKVRIGNREDEYAAQARTDGFEVVSIAAAAVDDVVYVVLPDESSWSAPMNILLGLTGVFLGTSHGQLGLIGTAMFAVPLLILRITLLIFARKSQQAIDVLLMAPRMAGNSVRSRYLEGRGFWAYVGVETDHSGRAQQRMLGLAEGLGVLRAGAVQMTAKAEATLDLFVEQTVGAVLGMAIMMAFEVARDAGVPAEALVLEMYMSGEMEAVFQSFRETGFLRASEDHGPTAVFGGITRSLEMDREAMAESFRTILQNIQSGGFAQRFQDEARNGYPMLEFARAMMHGASPITEAEDRVRHLTSPDPSGSSPGT